MKAAIIFTRTKTLSAELAEKLQARGYAAAALNGDMSQSMREKVLSRLKKGSLDIVVATDVAARGIDVERISHVFNYDIPCDPESYIHRIGRTGRAGRQGRAFLFVSSREQHLLKDIERAVHKPIEQVMPPSLQEMSTLRSQQLAGKIVGIVTKSKKYQEYLPIVAEIVESSECSMADVAAALAYLVQESNPLPSEELAAVEEDSGDGAKSAAEGAAVPLGVMLPEEIQEVVREETQEVVQEETQEVVREETQEVVQEETQEVVQEETQEVVQEANLRGGSRGESRGGSRGESTRRI